MRMVVSHYAIHLQCNDSSFISKALYKKVNAYCQLLFSLSSEVFIFDYPANLHIT